MPGMMPMPYIPQQYWGMPPPNVRFQPGYGYPMPPPMQPGMMMHPPMPGVMSPQMQVQVPMPPGVPSPILGNNTSPGHGTISLAPGILDGNNPMGYHDRGR